MRGLQVRHLLFVIYPTSLTLFFLYREAGCALVGGETAEMSGLFLDEQAYDIVGSTIGAIPRDRKILPAKDDMKAEDVLLGLSSSGCHSNGFSLIRKILEQSRLDLKDKAPWADGELVGRSLLTPTRIYVKPLLKIIRKNLVKGMAHITGGGLVENVPRMLPQHLAAEMDVTKWEVPKVLQWLKVRGQVENKVGLFPVLCTLSQDKVAIPHFKTLALLLWKTLC